MYRAANRKLETGDRLGVDIEQTKNRQNRTKKYIYSSALAKITVAFYSLSIFIIIIWYDTESTV